VSALPTADLAASFDRFWRAVQQFFSTFSDVAWEYVVAALAIFLVMQLMRGHAWANALRAAFPTPGAVLERPIVGSFLVGVGLNSILPARGGDAVKIVLAKRSIPGSSFPAVISSFAVLAPFDSGIGFCVLGYALTQGLFPAAPRLPDLPAFDISFWAAHPDVLLATVAAAVALAVAGFIYLRRRARRVWDRLKQGVVILRTPRRYLREVAAWQAAAWGLRFASFWLFLDAFGIGGSFDTVLLVMAVGSVAGALPFTPGGAGASQALLVASLSGPPRTLVLAYSVGHQLAVTAFSVLVSFGTLLLVFGIRGFGGVLREGRAAQEGAGG
jgi:uncharacterized membrane protein YbhN (UPF0104 family)